MFLVLCPLHIASWCCWICEVNRIVDKSLWWGDTSLLTNCMLSGIFTCCQVFLGYQLRIFAIRSVAKNLWETKSFASPSWLKNLSISTQTWSTKYWQVNCSACACYSSIYLLILCRVYPWSSDSALDNAINR